MPVLPWQGSWKGVAKGKRDCRDGDCEKYFVWVMAGVSVNGSAPATFRVKRIKFRASFAHRAGKEQHKESRGCSRKIFQVHLWHQPSPAAREVPRKECLTAHCIPAPSDTPCQSKTPPARQCPSSSTDQRTKHQDLEIRVVSFQCCLRTDCPPTIHSVIPGRQPAPPLAPGPNTPLS